MPRYTLKFYNCRNNKTYAIVKLFINYDGPPIVTSPKRFHMTNFDWRDKICSTLEKQNGLDRYDVKTIVISTKVDES